MDFASLSEHWLWLLQIAVTFFLTFLISFIIRKIASLQKQKSWKHQKITNVIFFPLMLVIWAVGIVVILDLITAHYELETINKYVSPLKGIFIVLALSWVSMRWIKDFFKDLAEKSEKMGVASGTIYALSKLVRFIIVILTLMIVFQFFNISVLPLITFGGIGVAGVAFAAQDIIANFFGGFMLHITRNFSIGDEIFIPSNNPFEGVVKDIGWYITVIEDRYCRPIYFPNALFSKTPIINESRRTHRRIKESIKISYDGLEFIEKIIEDMRAKISAHPEVDATKSFSITFNQFSESGLEISLYLLTQKMPYIQFMQVRQDVFFMIKAIVEKYGVPFDHTTTNINVVNYPPLKGKTGDSRPFPSVEGD